MPQKITMFLPNMSNGINPLSIMQRNMNYSNGSAPASIIKQQISKASLGASPTMAIQKAPSSLNAPFIARVHNVKPGCGACGRH